MNSLMMTHGLVRAVALLHFVFLLWPGVVSCAGQWPALSSPATSQGAVLGEEKFRLGSTPPSCHNRCNACSPCTAVQVPTVPGPTGRFVQADQPAYSQYGSNYKPLGWKCSCDGRLFNP
ncbi:Epidermal patterning factor-like protein 1 [Apostasia shenzhenica]|uniref:Epidermal patterning factor-like protein n=1 Tax=Apostasia shenzhenica TaxID=1088818 RepID=A0A2I0AC71_9ASPA|nr:Epidermal patterning factor-like protein 1 [Apostasia shenzhenica]